MHTNASNREDGKQVLAKSSEHRELFVIDVRRCRDQSLVVDDTVRELRANNVRVSSKLLEGRGRNVQVVGDARVVVDQYRQLGLVCHCFEPFLDTSLTDGRSKVAGTQDQHRFGSRLFALLDLLESVLDVLGCSAGNDRSVFVSRLIQSLSLALDQFIAFFACDVDSLAGGTKDDETPDATFHEKQRVLRLRFEIKRW